MYSLHLVSALIIHYTNRQTNKIQLYPFIKYPLAVKAGAGYSFQKISPKDLLRKCWIDISAFFFLLLIFKAITFQSRVKDSTEYRIHWRNDLLKLLICVELI